MRKNLAHARKDADMKQSEIASKLGLSVRQYQYIESGTILGKANMWDTLEDMLHVSQRELRKDFKQSDTKKHKNIITQINPKNKPNI